MSSTITVTNSSLFCMTLCDDFAGWANVVNLYMCCGHMQCNVGAGLLLCMILNIIIHCYYPLHVPTAWMINYLCKSVKLR